MDDNKQNGTLLLPHLYHLSKQIKLKVINVAIIIIVSRMTFSVHLIVL